MMLAGEKAFFVFPMFQEDEERRDIGNILDNPHIGMPFMDLHTGIRMCVNDDAEISEDPGWLKIFLGSLQTVKVTVREVYKQNRPVPISNK